MTGMRHQRTLAHERTRDIPTQPYSQPTFLVLLPDGKDERCDFRRIGGVITKTNVVGLA